MDWVCGVCEGVWGGGGVGWGGVGWVGGLGGGAAGLMRMQALTPATRAQPPRAGRPSQAVRTAPAGQEALVLTRCNQVIQVLFALDLQQAGLHLLLLQADSQPGRQAGGQARFVAAQPAASQPHAEQCAKPMGRSMPAQQAAARSAGVGWHQRTPEACASRPAQDNHNPCS